MINRPPPREIWTVIVDRPDKPTVRVHPIDGEITEEGVSAMVKAWMANNKWPDPPETVYTAHRYLLADPLEHHTAKTAEGAPYTTNDLAERVQRCIGRLGDDRYDLGAAHILIEELHTRFQHAEQARVLAEDDLLSVKMIPASEADKERFKKALEKLNAENVFLPSAEDDSGDGGAEDDSGDGGPEKIELEALRAVDRLVREMLADPGADRRADLEVALAAVTAAQKDNDDGT